MNAATGEVASVWPMAAMALALSAKHFLGDFVLQTQWMAYGKDDRLRWLAPLTLHALTHGALTLAVALAVAPHLWWLGIADAGVHFVLDRGKTLVGRWGGWTAQDSRYWWLFGFDQLLHGATNIALAAALLVL